MFYQNLCVESGVLTFQAPWDNLTITVEKKIIHKIKKIVDNPEHPQTVLQQ